MTDTVSLIQKMKELLNNQKGKVRGFWYGAGVDDCISIVEELRPSEITVVDENKVWGEFIQAAVNPFGAPVEYGTKEFQDFLNSASGKVWEDALKRGFNAIKPYLKRESGFVLVTGEPYADRICERFRAEIKNEKGSEQWDAALRTAITIAFEEYKPVIEGQ